MAFDGLEFLIPFSTWSYEPDAKTWCVKNIYVQVGTISNYAFKVICIVVHVGVESLERNPIQRSSRLVHEVTQIVDDERHRSTKSSTYLSNAFLLPFSGKVISPCV